MTDGRASTAPCAPGVGRSFAQWHDLIDRGDPRFTHALDACRRWTSRWPRIEASIAVSMWNMQRHHEHLRDRATHADLDASAAAQGGRDAVSSSRVASPSGAARCASSFEPDLRLAPVAHPLLICDGRLDPRRRLHRARRSGPAPTRGSSAARVGFYDRRVASAPTPAVPRGGGATVHPADGRHRAPAGRRRHGPGDRPGARASRSARCPSDVREMSRRLGARSRAHAIALISGVEG